VPPTRSLMSAFHPNLPLPNVRFRPKADISAAAAFDPKPTLLRYFASPAT
jgi:hypothetical protein